MLRMLSSTLALSTLLFSFFAHAGFFDSLKNDALKQLQQTTLVAPSASTATALLSETDIIAGLKQALEKGAKLAVDNLGTEDGFLANADVKVPIPESLQPITSALKMLGQQALIDDFQLSLNRAAEKAVPEAASIFSDTISNMSIEDASSILKGSDNAATEYFRQNSSEQLINAFLPIVKEATNSSGVASSYKLLVDNLGSMSSLLGTSPPDLDTFVAQKAIDGLFIRIAEQEKLIRENPAARTTDLLKQVFTQ